MGKFEDIYNRINDFMNSKSQINKKYNFNVIKKVICSSVVDITPEELREILKKLEVDGKIMRDEKDLYRGFPYELDYVIGKIKINKHGEGFFECNGEKLKVNTQHLHGALDGDIVLAKKSNKIKNGHTICKIHKIVKRDTGYVIVEIREQDGIMRVVPIDTYLDYPIVLNNTKLKALVDGDRLLVQIDELSRLKAYEAEIVKYIGHKNDPDTDLRMIAIQNGIQIEFSEESLKEAEAVATEVSESDLKGRLDLRDKLIFTIDGAKTKDRDDAISIELMDNGHYKLGVHIADVTNYIPYKSSLHEEAKKRSTSVYMADTVIPMLPHKLSNGICSLNPNVDRLTLSCIIELSQNGDILDYKFEDCVINSRKAMTYDEVNQVLEQGEIPEGYEEFVESLLMMNELAGKLEHKKVQRGYVNFGTNDIEIEMDENGDPMKFEQREMGLAQKLIENFMLTAGECAATFLMVPSPYRVHEQPDEERVEESFELLKKSGIKVKSTHNIVNGKVIQSLLDQIKNTDERDIAGHIILRSMNRARYSVVNLGHFGLGLREYCQFTSPIRRDPDLEVHYNIKMQRDNKFKVELVDEYYDDMNDFCEHATDKERKAEQAERDANEFEMVRYMSKHIGEKFQATVTFVNSRCIFIKTEEGIEGKLYAEDIEGDYFTYDDKTCSYRGKKSKIKIKLGTKLILTAIDTQKEFRTVNFGLDEEEFLTLKKNKKQV